MDPETVCTIVLTPFNGVSALACLILFWCYFQITQRGPGLEMIMILAISDFIFHISQIIYNWCNEDIIVDIASIFFKATFVFSTFWASIIAYITYRSIHLRQINNPSLYIRLSFIILAIPSIGLGCIETFLLNDYDFLVWLVDVPAPIALCITTFLSLRSISVLKKSPYYNQNASSTAIKVLYRYAFVQVMTMGPASVYLLINDITNWGPLPAYATVAFFFSIAGAANAAVYFFQRIRLFKNTKQSLRSESSTSLVAPQ